MRYADFLAFPGLQLNVIPGMPPTLRMPPENWKPNAKILGLTMAPPPIMPLGDTMEKVHSVYLQYEEAFDLNPNVVMGNSGFQKKVFKALNDAHDKRTIIISGLQGVPKDATPEALNNLGIQYCGIAYQGNEWLGGGFLRPDLPLTKAGEKFVRGLFEYGIIPDISHCGHTTARDVLKIAKYVGEPIVASHGGCAELFSASGRNLPDDILRGVAETGGIVGIIMVPFILGPHGRSPLGTDDFDLFVFHLLHAVSMCGIDNVCIGSDGYYSDIPQDEWRTHYNFLVKGLNGEKMGTRFPDQIIMPENLNTPDKLLKTTSLLKMKLPFSGGLVDRANKVMGRNLERFLRSEVLC
ncbi:MAG: membrane dipeptidase [Patescibacteria group bacterium]